MPKASREEFADDSVNNVSSEANDGDHRDKKSEVIEVAADPHLEFFLEREEPPRMTRSSHSRWENIIDSTSVASFSPNRVRSALTAYVQLSDLQSSPLLSSPPPPTHRLLARSVVSLFTRRRRVVDERTYSVLY